MKASNQKRRLSSILAYTLIALMGAASAVTGFLSLPNLTSGGDVSATPDEAIVRLDQQLHNLADHIDQDQLDELQHLRFKEGDRVGFIVETGEESLYTLYSQTDRSMTFVEFAATREARIASENMQRRQHQIFTRVAQVANVEFAFSHTSLMNAFSMNITYSDRFAVQQAVSRSGAIGTAVAQAYMQPQSEIVDNVRALDGLLDETGIFMLPEEIRDEFAGQGMVVSVIDSGLYYGHPMFNESNLPLLPNGDVDTSRLALVLGEDGILRNRGTPINFSNLTASTMMPQLSATHTFRNHKTPFVFNYVDGSHRSDVSLNDHHGTHVAGIIVGNTPEEYKCPDGVYVADPSEPDGILRDWFGEKVHAVRGVVPKAQLINMQVFSEIGTVNEVAIFSAVEDSVNMGVDIINMSLGSGFGFSDFAENDFAVRVYDRVHSLGINLIAAAGNSASAMRGGHFGSNLAISPESGAMGTPATMETSFSVASMEGRKSPYMQLFGPSVDNNGNPTDLRGMAFYMESNRMDGIRPHFVDDMIDLMEERPELKQRFYDPITSTITIPWARARRGTTNDFSGFPRDYMALIERGGNTFSEKIGNAVSIGGAIGAVIHNHLVGPISMSLDQDIVNPSAAITLDSHEAIANLERGFFRISADFLGGPFMSSFSSWGVTPDLQLALDITGHGGQILSSNPGGRYRRASGTSMAAPNVAGLAIAYRQYLTNPQNNFETARRFNLMNGTGASARPCPNAVQTHIYRMLQSTAASPIDQNGNPYSPRLVGAGLANIRSVLASNAWVEVPLYEDIEWRHDSSGQRLSYSFEDRADASFRPRVDGQYRHRSVLDMFDDPQRTGQYSLRFSLVNSGNTPLRFEPELEIFTETLSLHPRWKIIAERSTMLNPASVLVTSEGGVPINGAVI
ncbi:MAG: S8 family serine peptidase, partial [Firmicutes bacterium]|nr:S8 family serine peptidase [Bacillota bacterium]